MGFIIIETGTDFCFAYNNFSMLQIYEYYQSLSNFSMFFVEQKLSLYFYTFYLRYLSKMACLRDGQLAIDRRAFEMLSSYCLISDTNIAC